MTVPRRTALHGEHEWVAIDGTAASVGITDHAQNALGDVVFVSLPAVGAKVTAGEPCGEVESTKSVSDIYSPVDGEVAAVNAEIDDDPGPGQRRPVRGRAGCSRSTLSWPRASCPPGCCPPTSTRS